ncbi:hypothetical protein BaRGS_00004330 [Batillaria attramentaria]|uniref:Uncharacterized protein n=1 Tax=Batillaria attramentaria TaxID=370345 RepID=A0ABD0LYE4_9CAEN
MESVCVCVTLDLECIPVNTPSAQLHRKEIKNKPKTHLILEKERKKKLPEMIRLIAKSNIQSTHTRGHTKMLQCTTTNGQMRICGFKVCTGYKSTVRLWDACTSGFIVAASIK